MPSPGVAPFSVAPAMADALRGRLPVLAHCMRLLRRHGVVQFANGDEPDLSSGFCTDDNARALLLAVSAAALEPRNEDARAIGEAALAFIERAQLPEGGFRNLADGSGAFLSGNGANSEDAIGRAIWALGTAVRRAPHAAWRSRAAQLLERAWAAADSLTYFQPRAYALLGAVTAAHSSPRARDAVQGLAEKLIGQFEDTASPDWPWWQATLTWGCGRAPQAMLRAAAFSGSARYRECGLRALEFLGAVTQAGDVFMPVGSDGWYARAGKGAAYDQQPIEAHAMVDAWLAAAEITGLPECKRRAIYAFAWFFGANSEGLMVARPDTGGCTDGLRAGRVNPNMGAESTLSYLLAHLAIARDARGFAV